VLLRNESCLNNVSCFIQKHSVAKLLPTGHVINGLPRLKLLNAMTTFLIKSLTTKKSIYMESVQGMDLNRRYISGLEPEMPVTHGNTREFLIYIYIYIHGKFGHARSKRLTSPVVGSGVRCFLIQTVPQ
jgi:hypothetical protein